MVRTSLNHLVSSILIQEVALLVSYPAIAFEEYNKGARLRGIIRLLKVTDAFPIGVGQSMSGAEEQTSLLMDPMPPALPQL